MLVTSIICISDAYKYNFHRNVGLYNIVFSILFKFTLCEEYFPIPLKNIIL